MKKIVFSAALALGSLVGLNAQNFNVEPIYFVGSGTDTAYLVIDFQDQSFDTSYVWGYLFNSSTNGETMLTDIATADVNLNVATAGGFLNDIHYGNHSGVGGTGGFYWGTWSGTTMQNLVSNSGIGEVVNPQDIFACSFTDFSPAIEAGMPIPAYDATAFTFPDIEYWYGTGMDSTVLVVDFHNGEQPVAFGYLSDGTGTAEDMMNDLAVYDINLDVDISGGFLNQITYNDSAGLNGTNGFYWGTWSASNIGFWEMNTGVSEVLSGVKYFGCSFTDFNPAVRPFYPRTAIDPYLFTVSDIDFWIGSGSDTALFVVDFNDGVATESYAWGYLYDASQNVTAGDMMADIATSDNFLSINMGAFLNDIVYDAQQGLAGNPYYWSTWSATNTGNWRMNAGISEILQNGDWFGCSYDPWPPTQPGVPIAAPNTGVGIEKQEVSVSVFPNPVIDIININAETNKIIKLEVYNGTGQLVHSETFSKTAKIDIKNWSQGVYIISVPTENMQKKVIKL